MKIGFRSNLRTRIALRVALPVLLALSAISVIQYVRETQLIRSQVELSAGQIGKAIIANLREGMLEHNPDEVNAIIQQNAGVPGVLRIQLADAKSVVRSDSQDQNLNVQMNDRSTDCIGCHRFPPGQRPLTAPVPNSNGELLQVAAPIANAPECTACHAASQPYLGDLLVEVSTQSQTEFAQRSILLNLGLSILVTALIAAFVYWSTNRLITRRVEAFEQPLNAYSRENFSVRMPVSKTDDELDELARTFNHMIGKLEDSVEAEKNRGLLLQKTIIEERERIARELHDNFSQLLGYLNAKIGAITLFVESGRKSEAMDNLQQLEQATQRLFKDVREAIIGLRMTRRIADGLSPALRAYIDQFSEFCGLPVDYQSDSSLQDLNLAPEIQVHMLRIVQEALSNIRKHAGATAIAVSVHHDGTGLHLTVTDNGAGFDPEFEQAKGEARFGLQIMRERAEACGGVFMLESAPGSGTRISVSIPESRKAD